MPASSSRPNAAAYTIFGSRRVDRLLIDPATDLPVIEDGNLLYAAVPQRLPALAPLVEVILRNYVVWIRTQDGKLYLAP